MISTANCILLKALAVAHIENSVKDECEYSTSHSAMPHCLRFSIFNTDSGDTVYETSTINIKSANQEAVTDKLIEAVKACGKYL